MVPAARVLLPLAMVAALLGAMAWAGWRDARATTGFLFTKAADAAGYGAIVPILVLAIIATTATYAAYAAGLTSHRHHVSSWAIVAFTAALALPIGLGLA